MYKLTAEIEGLPLPKERQLDILIDMLVAVQRNTLDMTSAVFDRGNIIIHAELKIN